MAEMTAWAFQLYPNPLKHLARIRNRRGHAYEFYQKVGFVVEKSDQEIIWMYVNR